jgi:hypothetical protein
MNDPAIRPRRIVPPGSTPLRELAHAIAGALTLPSDVAELGELDYLRGSRDRARVVLFAMRRIIADHDLDDDDLMSIVATVRDSTTQLAAADTAAADPFRAFTEAIIAALTISRALRQRPSAPTCSRPASVPGASCSPAAAPPRDRRSRMPTSPPRSGCSASPATATTRQPTTRRR